MRDLDALRVFENPRPKSGAKYGAIVSLLQRGVPREGLLALINAAPWEEENKVKWRQQLGRIAPKVTVCPFCAIEPEQDCRVADYLRTVEARYTPMEVDLLG